MAKGWSGRASPPSTGPGWELEPVGMALITPHLRGTPTALTLRAVHSHGGVLVTGGSIGGKFSKQYFSSTQEKAK